MRFFSNEAKENADNDRDPDRAAAEGLPTPVPQQRVGSPWSDAPGSTDEPAGPESRPDAEARDDTVEDAGREEEALRRDDSEVRHDGDDLVRDADAPRHDSEVDLPLDDASGDHAGTHRALLEEGSASGRADAGQHSGTTTTYGPDGTVTSVDERADGERRDGGPDDAPVVATAPVESSVGPAAPEGSAGPGASVSPEGPARAEGPVSPEGPEGSVSPEGSAGPGRSVGDLGDTAGTGPADGTGPVGGPGWTVAPGTAEDAGAGDSARAADAEPVPGEAEAARAEADTAPGEVEAGRADTGQAAPAGDAAPAVPVGAAGAATAAQPDPNASLVGDKLFTDGDSFNERLRDIALSFVDDPKDATRQAAALVDEAIDKVTGALKAQKDALAGEGDDTERLRVELRGYRDILKRISSL